MIRFDDQPPMSPAADKWANSALKKSEKYRDKDASNLSYYGKNKHQRLYELPRIINKENIFLFYIHGGAWEFGYPEWVLFTFDYFNSPVLFIKYYFTKLMWHNYVKYNIIDYIFYYFP